MVRALMAAASAMHRAQKRVVAGSGPSGHKAQMRASSSEASRSMLTPELLYIGRIACCHEIIGCQLALEGTLEQAALRAVATYKVECQPALLGLPDHRIHTLSMV